MMKTGLYRFDDCVVDRDARELRRDGTLLVLPPKVFDSLIYLIEHRDRAVGRDELISAVWGKVDISDTLLSQTVLRARRAVGDKGNEQSVIRTVPRFGYRWVAAISEESPVVSVAAATSDVVDVALPSAAPIPASPASALPAALPPELRPAPRPLRSRAVSGVAAIVLVLLLAAGLYWIAKPGERAATSTTVGRTTATSEPAMLVVPVEVVAGADWTWLRLGLMELIASRVRASGQAVVPNDTIVALMRTQNDAAGIDSKALLDATGAQSLIASAATHSDG